MTATRRKRNFKPLYVFNASVLVALGIVTFYPFWYVAIMSFSTNLEAQNVGLMLLPRGFTLDNFRYIATYENFTRIYMNTFFVVVVGTLLSIVTTVLCAYPLAKRIPGSSTISYMVFFTLLFSGGIIPTFLVVKSTGLLNSLWSLILPAMVNPFYIFLMINFFKTIPDSLSESAEIDGAGVLRILWRIVLPVSLPGITTLILFYAVNYWNAYFSAMIYLSDRGKWTLQLLLREILINTQAGNQGMTDVSAAARMGRTLKMATIMTAVVPIMLVYPFVQKYFVQGVMVGAVKG